MTIDNQSLQYYYGSRSTIDRSLQYAHNYISHLVGLLAGLSLQQASLALELLQNAKKK